MIYDQTEASNKYWHKSNLQESQKFAFTTHDHAFIYYCYSNILNDGVPPHQALNRTINLHIDTGADAKDFTEEAGKEKLKPLEVEFRRLEDRANQIWLDLEYMKAREMDMRNINESTNSRVLWFSTFCILTLVGVGAWQVWYLRSFFQQKKLI
ncbi:Transmembrane emp24 domain-containing protein 10 [Borealophlyctis nickersoniae]|nr:Transmembrane emp24 domain-containing protein 10 [Borealophlyctis nickersoniae]